SGSISYFTELGMGVSLKRISDEMEDIGVHGKGFAYDFGLLAKLPIVDIIEKANGSTVYIGSLRPQFDISAGYSLRNKNDRVEYPSGVEATLDTYTSKGYAVTIG
ncbi:MAG: hypothetical protein ACYC25_15850, partial [Paludibacter sp.]